MMFQKRRSMLGRRHLMAQQQALTRPIQSQAVGDGSDGSRSAKASWRGGRSGKKKTPSHLDKASKDICSKKRLFSKSPVSYMGAHRVQNQDRNLHSSNENLLNETGITSIAPTPNSTPRNVFITPASLQRRRAEMQKARYGPLPSAARLTTKTMYESDKPTSSSSSLLLSQSFYSYDFDNLKPPDSPGPSRLERILLEEKLAQTSSSSDFYNLKPPDSPGPSRLERILLEERLAQTSSTNDFYNLKPPDSPGPSRLDRLIMEEKLEQPLDPHLKKIESLEDPNPRSQFSPTLSSTYIGSPDSGKKNATAKKEIKETALGSGRKLSTINENCDLSVIEFELNERTICDVDNTLMEATINNTVKFNNASRLGNILEDQNNKCTEEFEPSWEDMLSRLDTMERVVIDRAISHAKEMKILKEQIETIQKKIESESIEDISNIRLMKKTLETLKRTAPVARLTENKENNFEFRVPTSKKEQLDEESKWFNSVKKKNPCLLKTPNPSRKINNSLTPHSLGNVLHVQMTKLYD